MTDHQELALDADEGRAADELRTADELRAADGRIPGRRGRATRDRLVEATAHLLETTEYRDLSVVDIARHAETSPATFYQYFSDVQAAILVLAQRTAEAGAAELAAPLEGASWRGATGYDTARELADHFFWFWRENRAVLSVVDLAIAEGDGRFREIRNDMLRPVILALCDVIPADPAAPDPTAQASVLVSMLVHVAEHARGLEAWGVDHDDARDTMARLVSWSVTGRRPRAR